MVLGGERRAEGIEVAGEDIDASGVEGTQIFVALHNVQRCAALGACLGQNQGTVGKVERGERLAPGKLGLWSTPVQAAGNHQVQDQPKIILYADCNALAYTPQFADDVTFRVRNRRLRGAQEEGAGQAYAVEWLTDDARFERGDVG